MTDPDYRPDWTEGLSDVELAAHLDPDAPTECAQCGSTMLSWSIETGWACHGCGGMDGGD